MPLVSDNVVLGNTRTEQIVFHAKKLWERNALNVMHQTFAQNAHQYTFLIPKIKLVQLVKQYMGHPVLNAIIETHAKDANLGCLSRKGNAQTAFQAVRDAQERSVKNAIRITLWSMEIVSYATLLLNIVIHVLQIKYAQNAVYLN